MAGNLKLLTTYYFVISEKKYELNIIFKYLEM